MRTFSAIAGSALFLVAAPGVVAGVIPWLLTDHYRMPWSAVSGFVPLGWILVAGAAAILLRAFTRFALEGLGTPAPVAPTEKLVVGGVYRYVRNPMYVAVLSIILGEPCSPQDASRFRSSRTEKGGFREPERSVLPST